MVAVYGSYVECAIRIIDFQKPFVYYTNVNVRTPVVYGFAYSFIMQSAIFILFIESSLPSTIITSFSSRISVAAGFILMSSWRIIAIMLTS